MHQHMLICQGQESYTNLVKAAFSGVRAGMLDSLRTPAYSRDRPGYYFDSTPMTACPPRLSSSRPPPPMASLLQKTTTEPERPAAVLVERLPGCVLPPRKSQPEIV